MAKGTIDQLLDVLQVKHPLSEKQQQAIETMEWLHGNEHQGEGRTTALALFYIKKAMDNPGRRIKFHDHWSGESGQRVLRHAIKTFLGQLSFASREEFDVSMRHNTITFRAEHVRVPIEYKIGPNDNGDDFPRRPVNEIPLGEPEPCVLQSVLHDGESIPVRQPEKRFSTGKRSIAHEYRQPGGEAIQHTVEQAVRYPGDGYSTVAEHAWSYNPNVRTGRLRSDRPNRANGPKSASGD